MLRLSADPVNYLYLIYLYQKNEINRYFENYSKYNRTSFRTTTVNHKHPSEPTRSYTKV